MSQAGGHKIKHASRFKGFALLSIISYPGQFLLACNICNHTALAFIPHESNSSKQVRHPEQLLSHQYPIQTHVAQPFPQHSSASGSWSQLVMINEPKPINKRVSGKYSTSTFNSCDDAYVHLLRCFGRFSSSSSHACCLAIKSWKTKETSTAERG